jgi:hypothetical protein
MFGVAGDKAAGIGQLTGFDHVVDVEVGDVKVLDVVHTIHRGRYLLSEGGIGGVHHTAEIDNFVTDV